MSHQPAAAEGAPVVQLDYLLSPNTADPTNAPNNGKDKKSQEPLFGPNIGSVNAGPAWTSTMNKKIVTDELTPDIVNGWIQKSKESSQPTTTLQALVNLKRPTLRLSPLSSVPEDSATPTPGETYHQHHHGLEFEYDCDAPKCGIYVHVYLPKAHPDAPPSPPHHPFSKLLVFESVVEGGFASHLTLEDGALLELGRFEHVPAASTSSDVTGASTAPAGALPGTKPTNGDPSPSDSSANPAASSEIGPTGRQNARRRFTHFHFRRRSLNRSISGPALAVVDAEPAAQETKNKNGKDAENEGVKVTIRLAALDEQATELASPNEQITYLHIVRLGAKPADAEEGAEDTRPWVVKVVKREATIGPHTFHLHEIFGLTSSPAVNHSATPVTPSSPTHTYPPAENVQGADDDSPQSECLLCLSSPREVVLLPCRHLVACKDCALNMVEFGAGGNITQGVAEPAVPAVGGETGAAATPGAPATPPANQRRKRKAKGWFCPICRQPYTSLLRITTAPPPPLEDKDDSETEDEVSPPAEPETAETPTTEVRSGGLLGGALRPGFLRGLSLSRNTQQTVRPDVESTAGLGRVGV